MIKIIDNFFLIESGLLIFFTEKIIITHVMIPTIPDKSEEWNSENIKLDAEGCDASKNGFNW